MIIGNASLRRSRLRRSWIRKNPRTRERQPTEEVMDMQTKRAHNWGWAMVAALVARLLGLCFVALAGRTKRAKTPVARRAERSTPGKSPPDASDQRVNASPINRPNCWPVGPILPPRNPIPWMLPRAAQRPNKPRASERHCLRWCKWRQGVGATENHVASEVPGGPLRCSRAIRAGLPLHCGRITQPECATKKRRKPRRPKTDGAFPSLDLTKHGVQTLTPSYGEYRGPPVPGSRQSAG